MLRFFRQLRQRLLTDNKFSKYLLYAVGEILLVVIGILIALQINNWNEERIKDNAVRSHLESLADAIEDDIRELTISMEFNEFRFHSWQYLLRMSGIYMDSLKDIPRSDTFIIDVWRKPFPENIDTHFTHQSMRQINDAFLGMVFNYSAIKEINNLGVISDIENDSLRAKIDNYYYHLDWYFGEQLVNKRYKMAEDLKIYLRNVHEISCNYPPDPQRIFEVIRKDGKVVIMMKDLIQRANIQYWRVWELREIGNDLVESLQKEIN
jgi:hypothetical protein